MAEIRIPKSLRDEIEEIQPDIKQRVKSKLQDAAKEPEHYLEPLTGYNYYKIRSGDYRVIVGWNREEEIIYVLEFGHRDGVYDSLDRLPDVEEL